jgi:hypothetical protein
MARYFGLVGSSSASTSNLVLKLSIVLAIKRLETAALLASLSGSLRRVSVILPSKAPETAPAASEATPQAVDSAPHPHEVFVVAGSDPELEAIVLFLLFNLNISIIAGCMVKFQLNSLKFNYFYYKIYKNANS